MVVVLDTTNRAACFSSMLSILWMFWGILLCRQPTRFRRIKRHYICSDVDVDDDDDDDDDDVLSCKLYFICYTTERNVQQWLVQITSRGVS